MLTMTTTNDDDNSLPKKLHGGRGGLCFSVSGFSDSVFQLTLMGLPSLDL